MPRSRTRDVADRTAPESRQARAESGADLGLAGHVGAAASAAGRRVKTIHRDIEKLIPVAATIPTTAAASRCRPKNAT